MNKSLRTAIAAAASNNRKAMGLFLTSGFPTPDQTLPLLRAYDRGGADFVELGMPFSDPLAEGLPIQRSSAAALRHGIRMNDTLQTAEAFCRQSDTPLLLMGYINPILRYGITEFCRDAQDAGVAGLIIPDLPPDENTALRDEAEKQDLSLVFLIAPNTREARIRTIDEAATGFVYAVSVTGLTGSGLGEADATQTYLKEARRLVEKNPLLVGFGIRSHEDAMRLSAHTDGFIVGSACIEKIGSLWSNDSLTDDARYRQVEKFCAALKNG